MKKVTVLAIAFLMCACVLAGCAGEKKPEVLNLYTWAGMFPDDVIADFEKETGITVNYTQFDYSETMLSKLQSVGGGEYDLIISDDYIIETVIAEGLAQKLDKSKLSNYGNINPLYQGTFYDPTDEYTIPYGAGVQTIIYDPSRVGRADGEITGYADLWDASLKDSLGIIGNYRVINGMALKVLGYSYNTENLEEIEEAAQKLYELAPNIRLIKDDSTQNDLLSGEISAGVLYTSMVTLAKLENPELKVVFPEEGIGFGIMGAFIPSKAPNADAAHKFLDYIMDAERGAKCFEWLGYYCTFEASEPYINEDFKSFLVLPEELKSEDMEMIGNISAEAMEKHADVWTEFKTRCGQ